MGMKRDEIRRRFDEIVAFAGIPDFIDTPVKRYSSGMNARLGFRDCRASGSGSAADRRSSGGRRLQLSAEVLRAARAIPARRHSDRVRLPQHAGDCHAVRSGAAASTGAGADHRRRSDGAGRICLVPGRRVGRFQGDDGPRRCCATRAPAVEVAEPIVPGASLSLDVELGAEAELPRCGLAIQIVRSDGLVVFTGMSTLDGLPEIDLRIARSDESSHHILGERLARNIHREPQSRRHVTSVGSRNHQRGVLIRRQRNNKSCRVRRVAAEVRNLR